MKKISCNTHDKMEQRDFIGGSPCSFLTSTYYVLTGNKISEAPIFRNCTNVCFIIKIKIQNASNRVTCCWATSNSYPDHCYHPPIKLREGNIFIRVCLSLWERWGRVITTHDAIGQSQVTWGPPPYPHRELPRPVQSWSLCSQYIYGHAGGWPFDWKAFLLLIVTPAFNQPWSE